MADYAIVIKACSKIVCHALSRIKTKAMSWILSSGFAGLFTVYLDLIFFYEVHIHSLQTGNRTFVATYNV